MIYIHINTHTNTHTHTGELCCLAGQLLLLILFIYSVINYCFFQVTKHPSVHVAASGESLCAAFDAQVSLFTEAGSKFTTTLTLGSQRLLSVKSFLN